MGNGHETRRRPRASMGCPFVVAAAVVRRRCCGSVSDALRAQRILGTQMVDLKRMTSLLTGTRMELMDGVSEVRPSRRPMQQTTAVHGRDGQLDLDLSGLGRRVLTVLLGGLAASLVTDCRRWRKVADEEKRRTVSPSEVPDGLPTVFPAAFWTVSPTPCVSHVSHMCSLLGCNTMRPDQDRICLLDAAFFPCFQVFATGLFKSVNLCNSSRLPLARALQKRRKPNRNTNV